MAMAVTAAAYATSNLHGLRSYQTPELRQAATFAFVIEACAAISLYRWGTHRRGDDAWRLSIVERVKRVRGTELVKNEKRILLELLRAADEDNEIALHGYALNKRLAGNGKPLVSSTLYRALDRLTAAGTLTSEWVTPKYSDQRRRTYSLTPLGRSMAQAVADGDPIAQLRAT